MIKYGSKTAVRETQEKRQLNDDRKNSAFGFLLSERKNNERWQEIMQKKGKQATAAAEMCFFLFYIYSYESSMMNAQREINIYVYVCAVHIAKDQIAVWLPLTLFVDTYTIAI